MDEHLLVNEFVIFSAFNAFVWPPLLEHLDQRKVLVFQHFTYNIKWIVKQIFVVCADVKDHAKGLSRV